MYEVAVSFEEGGNSNDASDTGADSDGGEPGLVLEEEGIWFLGNFVTSTAVTEAGNEATSIFGQADIRQMSKFEGGLNSEVEPGRDLTKDFSSYVGLTVGVVENNTRDVVHGEVGDESQEGEIRVTRSGGDHFIDDGFLTQFSRGVVTANAIRCRVVEAEEGLGFMIVETTRLLPVLFGGRLERDSRGAVIGHQVGRNAEIRGLLGRHRRRVGSTKKRAETRRRHLPLLTQFPIS